MEFLRDVPLAPYTTLKVGGNAAYFVRVTTAEELRAAATAAARDGLPVRILGGGSNVLIDDQGVAGLVIKNDITGVSFVESGADVIAHVGAGEVLDSFIADTVSRGYWGLENLSCIPGTVGATPVQNVGAYGVEVADCITAVEAFDLLQSDFVTLTPAACAFGYRDSLFKQPEGARYLITHVTLRLSSKPQPRLSYKDLAARFLGHTPTLAEIRTTISDIRSVKFPDWTLVGTAGSFFKNPIVSANEAVRLAATFSDVPQFSLPDGRVKVSLGFMLDKVCGLRGYTRGAVGLYEKQALVLVTHRPTTAAEIGRFAEHIAEIVFQKTGIVIEWEVTRFL